MKQGKTGIGEIRRFPTDNLRCHIGAEIRDDQSESRFSDEEKQRYDLCAQYAIIAARNALADSGVTPGWEGAEVVGLAFGTCNGGIASLEEQWTISGLDRARTARYPFYQQGDDVAGYFGLNGPVITLNTACSASGNAIGFACDMICHGYADAMLAGGSDSLSHTAYAGFNVLRALSPEPTAPFSNRFGLSLGEGAAFVVLEPLERAVRRGATIYAEISGYGLSNDAYHETAPHPAGEGVTTAVREAMRRAAVDERDIDYINTHGTGTQANDQAEIAGLRGVFGARLSQIPLGSSKAYFGHMLGAAAAAELTTTLYAIHRGWLPATLHYDQPRPGCENIRVIANRMIPGHPEYILSNNSAFGGHNAAIVARIGGALKQPDSRNLSDTADVSRGLATHMRRVVIVGIGSVIEPGIDAGRDDSGEAAGDTPFSLKQYRPDLYERRMNRLCQTSIGAACMAIADAGWEAMNDRPGIGWIYGTSHGSTEGISNYLNSVFLNRPEFASSLYFPSMAINSTSGKTAEKLRLTGFSSSLSGGGTEGIASLLYACCAIADGEHDRFLIATGDDRSELADKIAIAMGMEAGGFHRTEGSVCLALADLAEAKRTDMRIYAEVKGCGMAFGDLPKAVTDALRRSNVALKQIGGIVFNFPDPPGERDRYRAMIAVLFDGMEPTTVGMNERYGYGESIRSLLPVSAAAKWLHDGIEGKGTGGVDHILAVSVSVNGNASAAIVARFAD
jgi:3-oxoacyl-[acyl-carrier-protein] synthase II